MEYTYLLINIFTILIPLIMSFEKRLKFISNWKQIFSAISITGAFFIIWDIWFTDIGIWSFNPKYLTGIRIINLPLEEWLFFITIPYALLFVYENIRHFVKIKKNKSREQYLNMIILVFFIAVSSYTSKFLYTFVTFLFLSVYLILSFIFTFRFNFFKAYISYLISLIPFFIVNGLLTYLPVVIYNDKENLAVRLYSIPVEDIFYGLLLFLINLSIYEGLLKRRND